MTSNIAHPRPLPIVAVLACAFFLVLAIAACAPSGSEYAFADKNLPRHLIGRWDWTTRAHPCGDSSHVISFSADRKTMTIAKPRTATDTGWTATYDILSLTPSRLRGAIRGEDRRTDSGVPVVWDLVMFGPDEYHWHRTDWSAWQFTPGIVRCGAEP